MFLYYNIPTKVIAVGKIIVKFVRFSFINK